MSVRTNIAKVESISKAYFDAAEAKCYIWTSAQIYANSAIISMIRLSRMELIPDVFTGRNLAE